MSIPPLVCSTPPPPDQCEDDKDHDDYELQYNLSQEDDESNDYDFGNYPTYNHFQTSEFNKQEIILSSNTKDEEGKETAVIATDRISMSSQKEIEENVNTPDTKDSGIKLGHEDDFDIEDLNLKIDSESSGSSVKDNSSGDEINKDENSISIHSVHVSNTSSSESNNANSCLPIITNELETFQLFDNESIKLDNFEKDDFQGNTKDIVNNDNTNNQAVLGDNIDNEILTPNHEKSSNVLEGATDDDFGDFDEFQFIAPESKSNTVLDSYENPWEDNTTDNTDFGSFTANFDNEITHKNDLPNVASNDNHSNNIITEQKDSNLHNDDDDGFGDFDDFQFSVPKNEQKLYQEKEICDTVPVLNLQSTENEAQIMESINKVVSSLFQEEILETVSEDEPKLESLLSETWGHLTETDVRQPYIINWNSSVGQKTLLKALCIDSRNILFGPKWGHNMPKYAANLSSAPLQPQKQLSNTPQTEITSSEKVTNKPNNWTDPFSSNGQQSCNTENESNAEPRPTDLDVFEAAVTTKSDKIYSSTINVQPIRQISLPDTHIFTPTDSETPRSKTIHYDSMPTLLLPQAITDKHENQVHSLTSQSSCSKQNKVDDDDDYWEFQEFKSTPKTNNTSSEIKNQTAQSSEKGDEIVTINNPLPKPSMAYQTELLQPIKLEPAIPKLNWPDPGEVKEEFDAFSDFASTSSWVDTNTCNSEMESIEPTHLNNMSGSSSKQDSIIEKEIINPVNENTYEDDFDTFKSALPSTNKTIDFNSDSLSNAPNNYYLAHNTNHLDYEHSIIKESSVKTDIISFESTVKSNENLHHTLGSMTNTTESSNITVTTVGPQLHMNLLQPTSVNSTAIITSNHQKSGQILQPLSLESYSQINWPSPGIDLQDLSRFNPVETLHSLKSDLNVSGQSRGSPIHTSKPIVNAQVQEDDVWGEFVSSKPTPQLPQTKKQTTFGDDDEWTDFVSSPSVKPHNGLNTISLNVHTNSNIQKTTSQNKFTKSNQISLDIPTLNYITPKTNHKSYNNRHFQNL